ncbi:MAG TPA: glutamyl-tRNA reductase [Acidobacteriota bacterium]|nr:glutamyl-tRNA reductase [Acidobacteriota bacterium]
MAKFVLVGLSHRTAEVEVRERVAFQATRVPDMLRQLAALPAIRESMIISTCNRVELISYAENVQEAIDSLESFLSESSQIARQELRQKLYHHSGEQVVRHLFRVASSLDSMILGEPQILGQVKSFYNLAVDAQSVGSYLNSLLQAAFRAAKRVRSETGIGEYSVSVSSAAVELARKILGDLRNKRILIVGAGKMGEVAVRHLSASGATTIRVTNRSFEAAQELASKFRGTAVPFEELTQAIMRSDIVITSTGSKEVLVNRAMAHSIMSGRKNAPIIFIDISVPRNVDPGVAGIDNVFCYDIDDLGAVVEANLQERHREAALAEKIVEQEVDSFCARVKSLDIGPVISQLQGRIEEICRLELDRYVRRVGPLDPRGARELESMVSRIAGKIAHPLVTQLRSVNQDPVHHEAYLSVIKRIFKLHKETEEKENEA